MKLSIESAGIIDIIKYLAHFCIILLIKYVGCYLSNIWGYIADRYSLT